MNKTSQCGLDPSWVYTHRDFSCRAAREGLLLLLSLRMPFASVAAAAAAFRLELTQTRERRTLLSSHAQSNMHVLLGISEQGFEECCRSAPGTTASVVFGRQSSFAYELMHSRFTVAATVCRIPPEIRKWNPAHPSRLLLSVVSAIGLTLCICPPRHGSFENLEFRSGLWCGSSSSGSVLSEVLWKETTVFVQSLVMSC